jgi:hypothetical protein
VRTNRARTVDCQNIVDASFCDLVCFGWLSAFCGSLVVEENLTGLDGSLRCFIRFDIEFSEQSRLGRFATEICLHIIDCRARTTTVNRSVNLRNSVIDICLKVGKAGFRHLAPKDRVSARCGVPTQLKNDVVAKKAHVTTTELHQRHSKVRILRAHRI